MYGTGLNGTCNSNGWGARDDTQAVNGGAERPLVCCEQTATSQHPMGSLASKIVRDHFQLVALVRACRRGVELNSRSGTQAELQMSVISLPLE